MKHSIVFIVRFYPYKVSFPSPGGLSASISWSPKLGAWCGSGGASKRGQIRFNSVIDLFNGGCIDNKIYTLFLYTLFLQKRKAGRHAVRSRRPLLEPPGWIPGRTSAAHSTCPGVDMTYSPSLMLRHGVLRFIQCKGSCSMAHPRIGAKLYDHST